MAEDHLLETKQIKVPLLQVNLANARQAHAFDFAKPTRVVTVDLVAQVHQVSLDDAQLTRCLTSVLLRLEVLAVQPESDFFLRIQVSLLENVA